MLAILMGFYGVTAISLGALGLLDDQGQERAVTGSLRPNREEVLDNAGAIARGGLIGILLGVLSGMTNSLSTFCPYVLEKRVSSTPVGFGKVPYRVWPVPKLPTMPMPMRPSCHF